MSASVVSAPPAVEHAVGPLADIPLGEGRAYVVDGRQVAVFRLRDGRVRALQAVCPHKGGPLADGQVDLRVVMCPLHANVFELDTGCSTTGETPARTYDVRVDDAGAVLVTVPVDEAALAAGPPSDPQESLPTGAPAPGPAHPPPDAGGAP